MPIFSAWLLCAINMKNDMLTVVGGDWEVGFDGFVFGLSVIMVRGFGVVVCN